MSENPFESPVFGPPDPPRKDVMIEVFETPMSLADSYMDSAAITVGGYFAETLQRLWKHALISDVDWVLEVTKALCDAGTARDGDHAYDLVAEALDAWQDSHG